MFCNSCGKQNPDGSQFCVACGATFGAQGQQPPQQQSAGVPDEKTMGILGCIPFLFFIPLVAMPNSKFGRYYANQGLILSLAYVALIILRVLVNAIFFSGLNLFTNIGAWDTVNWLFWLVGIAMLVPAVIAMMSASQKQMKPMPIIGNLFTVIK